MNAIDAERAVLGCMLLFPAETESVYRRLSPKMFSAEPLGVMFNCCMKLHKQNIPVDVVTVISKLGDDYKVLIATCAETVPAASRFDFYCDLVLDAWRVREMKQAAMEIATDELGSEEIIQRLSDVLARQNVINSTLEDSTAKDFTQGAIAFLESMYQPDTSIKTGWQQFDRVVGGLQRKSVYVISARPGKGKTDFALQIATKVSMSHRTVYCSMEMPTTQLMQRIAARATRINSTKIRDKALSQDEQVKVTRAMELMAEHCKVVFDEASMITSEFVEERILKYKPDVIFIDHLGLMDKGNKKNQWEAVTEVTHRLKALAMMHNVAVVELVQLNRATDGRKATQGDLYGGASVEQDADAIFALNVEPIERFLDGDESVGVTVDVMKNRHGGVGEMQFAWQPQYHNYIPMEVDR